MKLALYGECNVSWAERESNAISAQKRGLPGIKGPSLAVVGGGPSIWDHVETLRNFRGEIWAINGTIRWCRANGIDATLYSGDATDLVAAFAHDKAILADVCHPKVFDACKNVEVFRFSPTVPGPTSATTTLTTSIDAGYRRIVYFGCESSYEGKTHAYQDLKVEHLIKVECNGQEFLTEPEFIMQAEILSAAIRTAPHVYSERSGGLLGAMVECGEWDAVAATRAFMATLRKAS